MSRLSETFRRLAKEKKTALMPFITAGDPDMDTSYRLLLELEQNGADIIELGIPFSDPIADGLTIQRSSQRSLKKGANVTKIMDMLTRIREKSKIPIVFMTYYNLVYHYGVEKFVKDSVDSGANGLIIPDLPPEEAFDLRSAADRYGLDIIFLLAPTSTPERIKLISNSSSGFIYYVSLTGITGARTSLADGIKSQVESISHQSDTPVAVGFGISTPAQAAQIAACADGVIVGSALINIIESNLADEDALIKKAGEFILSLRREMDKTNDK